MKVNPVKNGLKILNFGPTVTRLPSSPSHNRNSTISTGGISGSPSASPSSRTGGKAALADAATQARLQMDLLEATGGTLMGGQGSSGTRKSLQTSRKSHGNLGRASLVSRKSLGGNQGKRLSTVSGCCSSGGFVNYFGAIFFQNLMI